MTQQTRRRYLIQRLLEEETRYRNAAVPADEDGQRNLLRALMNVRPPKPADQEFLEMQDQYLQKERERIGVVKAADLPVIAVWPQLALWQGDITTLQCDAIVNAANSALLGCFLPLHGCIDNAIHSAAGVQLAALLP